MKDSSTSRNRQDTQDTQNRIQTVYEATQYSISIRQYIEKILEEDNKLFGQKLDSIEELFNIKFKSLEELIEQRFRLEDQALMLANRNIETKLEHLNKLRTEVLEDRANYITWSKYESDSKGFDIRLKALENWQSKLIGVAIGIGLVSGIVGGIIVRLLG